MRGCLIQTAVAAEPRLSALVHNRKTARVVCTCACALRHCYLSNGGTDSALEGLQMPPASKDLLSILKTELELVESGGYRTPQRAAWRPQFIFQDSPTCLNFRNFGKGLPCSQCALIQFVPNGQKQQKFPCRHIPLDDSGQTLDSLYCTGTEEETYAIIAQWLKATIQRLEREGASAKDSAASPESQTIATGNRN